MTNIQMKSSAPFTEQTITSINNIKVQTPLNLKEIHNLNQTAGVSGNKDSGQTSNQGTINTDNTNTIGNAPVFNNAATVTNTNTTKTMTIPPLIHTTMKGQKIQFFTGGSVQKIKACLGWNISNTECDVDVSAFMLDSTGKVPGDDWFVFYGQTKSPDGSVIFNEAEKNDRESITIDLNNLSPSVKKIVFVLTINEAYEKKLNFSMIKDAYVRILNYSNNSELVSFKMDEYYENVTSMMIGEVYLHNGNWKFNAVGNGVSKDLAGLCRLYGVQIV